MTCGSHPTEQSMLNMGSNVRNGITQPSGQPAVLMFAGCYFQKQSSSISNGFSVSIYSICDSGRNIEICEGDRRRLFYSFGLFSAMVTVNEDIISKRCTCLYKVEYIASVTFFLPQHRSCGFFHGSTSIVVGPNITFNVSFGLSPSPACPQPMGGRTFVWLHPN